MDRTWPLVGRGEELALVEDALRRPELHGVVLAGEAGVGKTRLARESVELARSTGFHGEWAVGTHSSSAIPFGALAHLLPDDLLSPGPPGPTPPARNILAAAGEALAHRTGGEPLVLGVDDAHLLDGASAGLLHHLTATRAGFLVIAVRSGEPVPDAIVGLWKDGLASRLEIQPLSRAETDRLVEAALGSQVEGSTLNRLFESTRGNPLFLRELVLGGLHEGSLEQTEGVWRWTGSFAPAPRLLDVLERRLGSLRDEERDVLEVVAEAESVGADDLEPIAGRTTVESLERRGLLESWTERRRTRVRLAHPLYAEAIRARIPPLRARAIRARLADGVEGRGGRRREDLLRVATWRLEAGHPLAPHLALEASRRSAQAFAYPLAERLARAARESADGFEATHALVDALLGQGRFAEAEDLLRDLSEQPLPEPVRATTAAVRAGNLFWRMGRGEAAWDVLRRAEEAITDPGLRDEVAATRATFLVFGGRTHEGIAVAIGVMDRAASDRAVAQAVGASWGLSIAGRTREARAYVERVRAPVASLARDAHLEPDYLEAAMLSALFFEGALEEAVAGWEANYRRATEQGGWQRGMFAWTLGWAELVRGRVRTAGRWLAEASHVLREMDMFNQRPAALAGLAQARALLGEVEEAEAALEEAERTRLPAVQVGEGPLGQARIWVAAAGGETSRAAQEAVRTAEVTGKMGQLVYQAAALHAAARLGAAAEVADELEEVARRADGRLIPAYAAHARALAATDAGALDEVSGAFEDMGAMLYAAEAAAVAGQIHRQEGRSGSALAASERAGRLAEACEGARTPALDRMDVPDPLTRREREVATLAASGRANQDIAERLVVSVRTVESHLRAAYAKLGVTGREGLEPILAPRRSDEASPKSQ